MGNDVFQELVLKNEETMYRISMSMLKNEADAQDAVHEAILKAYEKSYTLRKEEYFSTWLIRIVINCCKKQLKQKKRYTDTGGVLPDTASRDNPYLKVEIGEAIDGLPIKIRQVIIFYYIENYSIKEIKQILRIPEGTVKSRLKRGRTMLREFLGEYF